MFSESVTSSLHQGEMSLQKSVSMWQIRPGAGSVSPPTEHRVLASQCEALGVMASPHLLPRRVADHKVNRALCFLCVHIYS